MAASAPDWDPAPSIADQLDVTFTSLHTGNMEALKLLNSTIFPIKYSDQVYRDCMQFPQLTMLGTCSTACQLCACVFDALNLLQVGGVCRVCVHAHMRVNAHTGLHMHLDGNRVIAWQVQGGSGFLVNMVCCE